VAYNSNEVDNAVFVTKHKIENETWLEPKIELNRIANRTRE